MNKKIKVIELFKRIEKCEDIPQKIKYKDNCYIFKHMNYGIDHLYELIGHECIGWLEHKDINLFDEVEILEDNTEEIEELEKEQEAIANPKTMMQEIRFYYDSNKMGDKINEIIRYIKRKDKNND